MIIKIPIFTKQVFSVTFFIVTLKNQYSLSNYKIHEYYYNVEVTNVFNHNIPTYLCVVHVQ